MTESPVALVTGGSGGIGSAVCRRLAARGVVVVVHYNQSRRAAESLVAELDANGAVASALQGDVSLEGDAQTVVGGAVSQHGRLDYLVNNAGWTQPISEHELHALEDAVIDRIMRLKVNAPLYCIREAEPYLAAANPGSVINITSVSGVIARGSNHIYAAANAALSALTRSLARSLAPQIRVNAVAPGFVNTGFAWPTDGDMSERVAQNNFIERTVAPEDVASVVEFLCLDAEAITGEEVVVDGGIGRLGKRRGR